MDCLVRFLPSQHSVRVPVGTNLLEAARLAGVPLAGGCGGWGACSRCGVHIIEGGEAVPEESAGEKEAKRLNRVAPDLRMVCFISLKQDLSVTTPYWGPAGDAAADDDDA